MSMIFRMGTGPGMLEHKTVYADNGVDSVELGVLDEFGRLRVYDEAMCASVSLSPAELEVLAAFVRKQNLPEQACLPEPTWTTQAARVEINSFGFIRVEGHYSAFGERVKDGKVFFSHRDFGSHWEDCYTAQDLREIADAMDAHYRKEEA